MILTWSILKLDLTLLSSINIIITKMNNDQPNEPVAPPVFPPRPRKNFLLLFIICGLILLPLESLVGADNDSHNNGLYQMLNSIETQVDTPSDIVNQDYSNILFFFDLKQMQGTWKHRGSGEKQSVLSYAGGKATMNFGKHINNNTESIYTILELFNGNYIDHGYVSIVIQLEVLNGSYTHTKGNYTFYLKQEHNSTYNYMVKLESVVSDKQQIIRDLNISFIQNTIEQKPSIYLSLQTDDFSIEIGDAKQNWHIFHHILLSALLCFMVSMEFISSMRIIRKLGLGQQAADKYSILTFFAILMWDFAITIITFFLCFSNDQLFLIYLIPTFISGILFAITELRILQFIFEAGFQNRGANIQQMGRFLGWLGLVSTYPLIYYTNLNSVFFILLPLILLPQLYKNAKRGRKTDIDPDFLKLFLPRFAIILYLKGFSKNVFSIQPSFSCCIGMLLVLGMVISLLLIQKHYGTRIIFPRFLLPQVYNYFQDQTGYSIDVQVGDHVHDCAICLMPVHMQPPEESQLSGEHVGKIMTTPCNHKFHGSCLVQWIQHKMECPTCRNKLPAYD